MKDKPKQKTARVRIYYRDHNCNSTVIEKIVSGKNKKLLETAIKQYLLTVNQDYYSYMVDQHT
ncbi:hypothetical protein A9Y76_07170 [Ralstonia insidiosa]|uniref:Uncharacterized protein n=1 Tax=Ralstonia insidiosa TaxID=190721 RepID=A0A191ZVY0_9RALS|nr:hypothetical protein A9Y76_07170 [Ralstonia insidiosa]